MKEARAGSIGIEGGKLSPIFQGFRGENEREEKEAT
jgi:hypothetical protein